MKKKIFIIITIVSLSLTFISCQMSFFAADNSPQYSGLLNGAFESVFLNDYSLTREEFCVIIAGLFFPDYIGGAELPFEDANQIKSKNITYVASLYNNGILTGSTANGKLCMNPDVIITKQEVFTLLGRILNKSSDNELLFFDADDIAPFAYKYVAWFAENGFIDADSGGKFNPEHYILTEELAELTKKTFNFYRQEKVRVETLFGTGSRGHVDGDILKARFTQPYGIALDKGGNVFILDTYNNAVRKIGGKTLTTITGSTTAIDDTTFNRGYYLDGELKKALLNRPSSGCFNSRGELIIADSGNNSIRIIRKMKMYTWAGSASEGFSDGGRETAMFNCPMAVAIDKYDNVYVADTLNNCIRKIDPEGNVKTIAGIPQKEGYSDGGAQKALFRAPSGIAVEQDGSVIYVADTGNHRIRKIENGEVTTIAGTTAKNAEDDDGDPVGGFKNGAANESMFNQPAGITLADGFIIVADSGNNAIRAVSGLGNVITIAGNSEPGDNDGGSPAESMFNQPAGVYYANGILYIADTVNNKIKTMRFDSDIYY